MAGIQNRWRVAARAATLGSGLTLAAMLTFAQQPANALSAAALEQLAEKKSADWNALAKALEAKLVRLLPCDPRTPGSIEEVKNASESRLAAGLQYLQAAAVQAHADTEMVAQAIAAQEAAARESDSERAEADQERIAVEAQLADLADSFKRRAALSDAQKALAVIVDLARQRGLAAQNQAARRNSLLTALGELLAASQARETAIQTEIAALNLETARWNDYYAARIARAQTECVITNQAPRSPQRKKQ